jgi:hypothetical protein
MKTDIPDKVMRWLGPIVVSAIGACLIFGNPISQRALCDGTANCLVTWVGALSGWAAAIAAAFTIGSLFKQAEAAQKQTDFQLGDAPPTIDLLPRTDANEELVIRIVNWNRRTLLLHSFIVTSFELSFRVWNVEIDDENVSFGNDIVFDPPLVVPGWENRQEGPHNIKITIIAMGKDNALIDHRQHSIGVLVQTALLGPVHEHSTLAARYEGMLA